MYTFTSKVRYSEVDEQGNLSLLSLMNYLQDCCLAHSADVGAGPAHLGPRHRAWLLSSWQVVIDRMPRMFEDITIGTAPYDFSAGMGRRNVVITGADGESLVRSASVWLFLNTLTNKPVRPEQSEIDYYEVEERIPMEYAPRHLALPKVMTPGESIPVRAHLIDTNHHVNNAQYVDLAREALVDLAREQMQHPGMQGGEEQSLFTDPSQVAQQLSAVKEIRVDYKKMALLGDVMYTAAGRKDDWYYVTFADADGNRYADVALRI